MRQAYVVGYLFSPDLSKVILLTKKHGPLFLRGLVTGPGGKVELGETPPEAMDREFREETGLGGIKWSLFASQAFDEAIVYFFKAVDPTYSCARSTGAEDVGAYLTDKLPANTVPDGIWLIPLAKYLINNPQVNSIKVQDNPKADFTSKVHSVISYLDGEKHYYVVKPGDSVWTLLKFRLSQLHIWVLNKDEWAVSSSPEIGLTWDSRLEAVATGTIFGFHKKS